MRYATTHLLPERLPHWARAALGAAVLVTSLACGALTPAPEATPADEAAPTAPNEAASPTTPTDEPTAPQPDTPQEETDDPMSEEFFNLPAAGRLAVLGADGNLFLLERDTAPVNLTGDAVLEPGASRIYLHPTWSPTGWLSYVRVDGTGVSDVLQVLALPPGESEPVLVQETGTSNYIYGYWSPAECDSGPDCGRFAYLMGEDGQIAFYLSQVASDSAEAASNERLRLSRSHYYTWSPDGESMLWFRDGTAMTVYDVASDAIVETFDDAFGLFQTPAWSPVDGRYLFGQSGGEGLSQVVIADGEERRTVSRPREGVVAFDWSPDGQYVAFASGQGFPLSPVTIAQPGGESFEVEVAENVVAFFWAPDSSKLAVVAVEEITPGFEANGRLKRFSNFTQQEGESVLVWYVTDVESGETTRYTEFLPTGDQLYLLQFFDQYSKSHQLWSPDSRYIVYAEQLPEDVASAIVLLDTENPGQAPIPIGAGRSAIFSYD